MTRHNSRRAFLRGGFREADPMRPFGALPPVRFEDVCTACGACSRTCPEGIILRGPDGYPLVDFQRGECTFCGECVAACEPGALAAGRHWRWRATISSACLARSGTSCRSCEDHCDARAIRFRLRPGGRVELDLDTEACTGCGACVAPCPVAAIQFTQIEQPVEAHIC